ncbi:MAG TPA: arpA protein [Mycobacteriales bacterium]|nr:arpA protein [Mycobacteriales bacterium]
MTTSAPPIDDVVDTARYPLSSPGSSGWTAAVARARHELSSRGCCVLPGFVRSRRLDALREECASVAPAAYHDVETVNVYNTTPDPSLPAGHPVRTTMERGNAFVPRDALGPDLVISRLYTDPQVQAFVAACFDLPEVHELADPLAGLCLNVLTPGREHPWHFDTNEFAVSLLTQAPEAGGRFEYCPDIRSAQSECFEDVAGVLAGRRPDLVGRVEVRPGALQLFRGRYALHRVSAVEGGTARHSAILAYSRRSGVVGSVERTRQLFGRVLPVHLAAEGRGVRGDALLD